MSLNAEPSIGPSGFFILDKPAGVSSAAALNAIKRALPRKTKVGHAGTLDPFATGVLVVLIGKATKMCERVMGLPKSYNTTLHLGVTTNTYDPEGHPTHTSTDPYPTQTQVKALLDQYLGDTLQTPPAFSAVKVGGRRAYDLARSGEEVKLQPRRVRVDRLELLGFEPPLLHLSMTVGRGFYVRSLARDLGEAVGTGGHLTALRRTAVGPFTEDQATDAFTPDRLLPLDWLDAQATR